MRFEGTIKSWDEAKGFGFLASKGGGQDIFVHVSALPRGTGTPGLGQAFTFEVELNREGKKRATKVEHAGSRPRPQRQARSGGHEGRSPLGTVLGMVLVVAIGVAVYGKVSGQFARYGAAAEQASAKAEEAPANLPVSFRCDGRTYCSQMTSCMEAKYFLKNCPGVKMDGNNDGIPCETQWCTSPFAR